MALTSAVAGDPGSSPSCSTASACDHRDNAERAGFELNLCEQAVDLHAPHDPGKAVSRRDVRVAPPAQPVELGRGHDAPVRGIRGRVRIFPPLSQRRSVSRLIPSRRAASAAGTACLGIA